MQNFRFADSLTFCSQPPSSRRPRQQIISQPSLTTSRLLRPESSVPFRIALALAVSDYAYVIAEGRIFSEGPSKKLVAMPEIRRAYLGL